MSAEGSSSSNDKNPSAVPPHMPALSQWSTPAIPDSAFCAADFLLSAGIVIIQEKTDKIVVVYDHRLDNWFLPRGRKDVGESLEATALREGYEESGFRPTPLPLITNSRQPSTSKSLVDKFINTEPIYITTKYFKPRRKGSKDDCGGEYITFWYVGSIPEDAVREEDTGMYDEKSYEGRLLAYEEALEKLWGVEVHVVDLAWKLYRQTSESKARLAALKGRRKDSSSSTTQTHQGGGETPVIDPDDGSVKELEKK